MEAERAGLRRINEARGIVRAHLEDDAHFKFTQRLSGHRAVHVVERIHGRDAVDAEAAAFGDEIVELRAGARLAFAGGK